MTEATTSEAPTQDTKCRLLLLPAELRNRIYELTLPTELWLFPLWILLRHQNPPQQPALTRTNRQIRRETIRLYYCQVTVKVDVCDLEDTECCGDWFDSIGDQFGCIKRFEISFPAICSHVKYFVIEWSSALAAYELSIVINDKQRNYWTTRDEFMLQAKGLATGLDGADKDKESGRAGLVEVMGRLLEMGIT